MSFWNREHCLLTAIIEVKSPNVFFTVSSADIQWVDMHKHMPGHDINEPENAHSYNQQMENLNNNPAIASYYFRKHWQIFLEEVLKPTFNIKDYWWQFEWKHRGSSHIHGFFWTEGAPVLIHLKQRTLLLW